MRQLATPLTPISRYPFIPATTSWWLAFPGKAGFGSSTWRDLVSENHGTLTLMDTSTCWKAIAPQGEYGSINFDGTNDYVDTQFGVTGSRFSVFVVARYDTVSGEAPMFGQGTGSPNAGKLLQLSCESITGTQYLLYRHGSGNIRYPLPTDATNWHTYCIVGNGAATTNDVLVYVDGEPVTGTRNAGSDQVLNVSKSDRLKLGAGYTGGLCMPGSISSIIAVDANLSPQGVQELHRQSKIGYADLLRHYSPRRPSPEQAAAAFKAYWARRNAQIIGAGV